MAPTVRLLTERPTVAAPAGAASVSYKQQTLPTNA
jgi:hypothetical protein